MMTEKRKIPPSVAKGLEPAFEYFRISNAARRDEIIELVRWFCQVENSFCAFCGFLSGEYMFLSPHIEKVLGYPFHVFTKNGFRFFYSITPPDVMPLVVAQQTIYMKHIAKPGFQYRKPFFMTFDAALVTSKNERTLFHQESVCLDYEPGGDFRTFFAIWIKSNQPATKQQLELHAVLKEKLTLLHRLMFSPGSHTSELAKKENILITLKTPDMTVPNLTIKERELLSLIAKGRSLKEAAVLMKASYFTAETHRKNLFKKFNVKNAAELIRNASKVFWLE